MKNTKYYISTLILAVAIISGIGFISFDENNTPVVNKETVFPQLKSISQMISERKTGYNFREISIFTQSSQNTAKNVAGFVSRADFLSLNPAALNGLLSTAPQDILFKINSAENGNFELELTHVNIIPDDFKITVIGENGISYETFRHPLTYRGVIKGNEKSVAAITVSELGVIGVISDERGDYVLGPKKDAQNRFTGEYIFYNDADLEIINSFECGNDNYSTLNDRLFSQRKKVNSENHGNTDRTTDPIRVFFTADFRTYQDNGSSTTQTAAFLTGMFNNVSTIYQNESIPTTLSSSMQIYSSPDPYIGMNDSYAILNAFGGNTQDNFNGDLAHIVSTGHNQQLGGIAWINVLCQPYFYFQTEDAHYGRFAFSNIENSYLPYPLYSWTVEVVTHEMGHNIASKHTHACVWPTNSGQIDSCYSNPGESCVGTTRQNFSGTIMSYCHLNGAINLANGFGQYPQDTIQYGYYLAECIDSAVNSSEAPIDFSLSQNFPNPFNPSTNIKFELPQDGFVTLRIYDISGREITTLLNSRYYNSGIFTYSFDASAFSLASGVYLYRLDVHRSNKSVYSEIKKMVLVK